MKLSTREHQPLRCAVCHDVSGTLATCNGCGSRWHVECVDGSCPTLGCGTEEVVGEKKPDAKGPTVFLTASGRAIAESLACAEEQCPFDNRQSALYRTMCTCGHHTTQQHEAQRAEFEQLRLRMDRERDEQRVFRAKVLKIAITFGVTFFIALAFWVWWIRLLFEFGDG